jgi:GxxExxY protein
VTRTQLIEETLTRSVIGAFFEVYNTLGFGFLEHLYVMALERELLARGHHVAREVWVRVTYKGEELGIQRVDMIVDDTLVVETKASLKLPESASRQLYNYLRATTWKSASSSILERRHVSTARSVATRDQISRIRSIRRIRITLRPRCVQSAVAATVSTTAVVAPRASNPSPRRPAYRESSPCH